MSPKAHIGPGCHSCACGTDEQTFAVKLSYFHMLFGHFSSTEKNEILGNVLILESLFLLRVVVYI